MKSDLKSSKYSVLSALKSVKLKDALVEAQIDRALIVSVCTSYDIHILKDKTCSRESFRRLRLDERDESDESELNEDRSSIIGKRFKYLMQKLLHSMITIRISTFFNNSKIVEFAPIYNTIMSEEPHIRPVGDSYKLEEGIISSFVKNYHTIDNAGKYWAMILEPCFKEMPKRCQVEQGEGLLKKLIDFKISCDFPFDILDYVFENFDYYQSMLPLVTELIKKNKIDSSWPKLIPYVSRINSDGITMAKNVVKRFHYLENFKKSEEIVENYFVRLIEVCNHSLYSNDYIYIDELMRLYPCIDLEKYPFSQGNCDDKVIELANRKGVSISFELLKEAFKKNFSKNTIWLINYVKETFKMDIYEIQKRTQFFNEFCWYQSGWFSKKDDFKNGFESIFSDFPIDLNRLLEATRNHASLWNNLRSIIISSFSENKDTLYYLQNLFSPSIFTLQTLSVCLIQCYDQEIKQTLFEITMLNETEKLSDHVDKILQEKDWTDFTDSTFSNYDTSDPRYLIAIYNSITD